MNYKNFEQFLRKEENLNENLRFEDSVKLESDINTLLEIYQSYYEDIEIAKGATYDPKVLEDINSIVDTLDSLIMKMKNLKK